MAKSDVPSEKIGFMPNSARLNEIPSKSSAGKKGRVKVIYTGNIGLAQDVDVLKELASRLNDENIDLSIVGYGMKKNELVDFVKENDLKNVRFYSPVTRSDVFTIKLEHDIGFVSLNDKKVFDTVLPGKIVDYMTCRLPIVASVSGYAKSVIGKEQVGLVSETRNINEIVEYILYLANNPKVRQQMAENEGKYIMNKFLWEKNISELVDRIEQIDCEKIPVAGRCK